MKRMLSARDARMYTVFNVLTIIIFMMFFRKANQKKEEEKRKKIEQAKIHQV